MRFREIAESDKDSDYEVDGPDAEHNRKVKAASDATQSVGSLGPYMDAIYSAVKKNVTIYRGMPTDRDYDYIDPTYWDRKSANTTNYSNLIFNNAPLWQKFPKRKIICTTNRGQAGGYGSPYVVIPLSEDAKIGVVPKSDIWGSFGQQLVPTINSRIARIAQAYGAEVSQTSWDLFQKNCNYLTQQMRANPEPAENTLGYGNPFLDGLMNKGVLEFLLDLYDPNKHGFKCVSYDSLEFVDFGSNNGNELWLDSPCLFISFNEWKANHERWIEEASGAKIKKKTMIPADSLSKWTEAIEKLNAEQDGLVDLEHTPEYIYARDAGDKLIGRWDFVRRKGWYLGYPNAD